MGPREREQSRRWQKLCYGKGTSPVDGSNGVMEIVVGLSER